MNHYFAQQEIGAKILASADSDGVLLNYFEGSEDERNLNLNWAEVRKLAEFFSEAVRKKMSRDLDQFETGRITKEELIQKFRESYCDAFRHD